MKLFLCMSLALGLIAIASALKCNICDFRVWSMCVFKGDKSEDCTGNCTITKASIGSVHLFSKQGCSNDCEVLKNQTDKFLDFNSTVRCCSTDMCNSGNSIKVSLSLGLGIGLLWLLNAM